MRYLLIATAVVALASCAERAPDYAPYESAAQRDTALAKVRQHCMNPEAAVTPCDTLILFRMPHGEPRVGHVQSLGPYGFDVVWTSGTDDGYRMKREALESPEYPGVIIEAAKAGTTAGHALQERATEEIQKYDQAIGKRIL